jgi:hypothetical protein
LSSSFPWDIIGLDEFLGIMDELESLDEFADFWDYIKQNNNLITPIASMLDRLASFKSSYGVLVDGASTPDFIMIDPHGGSSMRYQSLADFWTLYPKVGYFDDPRSWKVKKETESRVRLEAKSYVGCALYYQIGFTHIFISSPFKYMSFEQMKITNYLMECIEDTMSINKSIIEKHSFFKNDRKLNILLFPYSLVHGNEELKHLSHLCDPNEYWCSDCGFIEENLCGIRIVFNEELIINKLSNTKNASPVVDILIRIIKKLDNVNPDYRINSILDTLEKEKTKPARFGMLSIEKLASFPEFENPHKPSATDYKKARKRIAQLALEENITEGDYELAEAKQKIDKSRDSLISEINLEVNKYNFNNAIPYLITRIDSLANEYWMEYEKIKHGQHFETDYKPDVRLSEDHFEYRKYHKNYRYLIEKFVQLQPNGGRDLTANDFKYLIALINWLHVFYEASDNLHYGIHPAGMVINEDFLIEIKYNDDIESKGKAFSQESIKLELGLIGNFGDRADFSKPIDEFIDELDQVFLKGLQFSFRSLIEVLQVLRYWPEYASGKKESTRYDASFEEIKKICVKEIKGIGCEEIKPVLEFLTLRKADVICIVGSDEPCVDLPVWEHKKRYSRYNIRPLILINDKYYWGPYSVRTTKDIWLNSLSYGTLPVDLNNHNISEVIQAKKKRTEDFLVVKGTEIIERYTSFVEKELVLHKLDKNNNHPVDLGDYDILAFYPAKNVVLNIECKDHLPAFCLKDAKRLRERLFGIPGKREGDFKQINKRQDYLSGNLARISSILGWPIDFTKPPPIIPIYLSRRMEWWTRYPPKEIKIESLSIDLLTNFLNDLTV